MPRKPDRQIYRALADPAELAYAAAAVLERLAALEKETAGVRAGDDIEHLHRMRVASRRLRTALRVFAQCLPPRPLPVWQREVRRITRALGDARDLDVQLEFLAACNPPATQPGYRPGIARLRLRLSQRRAKLQQRVIRRLDEFESLGIADSLRDHLAALADATASSPALFRRAEKEITAHLEELLSFRTYVDDPNRVQELHQMRIAAKHLRYSLELFRPLFGERLDHYINAIKVIQQQLGELHDADVWRELLPAFIEKERRRTIRYFGNARSFGRLLPGIKWLQRRVVALRRSHYRAFTATWHNYESTHLWEQLLQTIRTRP